MTNKEAITHLKSIRNVALGEVMKEALTKAIEALEDKPQGKWIMITEPDGFIHAKCSACNQFNDWGDVAFCPWCGARMKGGAE